MAAPKMTTARARLLAEVRAAGERRYNGRARKTIEALRDLGLVEYDYSFREVGPYGGRYVDEYTVRPVKPAADGGE